MKKKFLFNYALLILLALGFFACQSNSQKEENESSLNDNKNPHSPKEQPKPGQNPNEPTKHITTQPIIPNVEKQEEEEFLVFIGNPGAGKSTIINSILKQAVVSAGMSVGGGLTKELKVIEHDKLKLIDSPGLDDIKIREQAQKEIEKALKLNGNYRIFFVLTLESGRVRPADLATINLVMNSIQSSSKKYNIIVNKIAKKTYENIDAKKALINESINLGDNNTQSIYYLARQAHADDEDNVLLNLDNNFMQWLYKDSLIMPIKASQVSEIKSDFDKEKEKYQDIINKLKRN
jgi:GTP-binding protein EngB required for normal cell division